MGNKSSFSLMWVFLFLITLIPLGADIKSTDSGLFISIGPFQNIFTTAIGVIVSFLLTIFFRLNNDFFDIDNRGTYYPKKFIQNNKEESSRNASPINAVTGSDDGCSLSIK